MTQLFISLAIIIVVALASMGQTALFQQDVSWSPDGKHLAFTGMHDFDRAANTYKADLYVIRTDGSDFQDQRRRKERILYFVGEGTDRFQRRGAGNKTDGYLYRKSGRLGH